MACPVEVILPKMTPLHASHLIRKKSSLAAKLRKVFVAKVPSSTLKDIQDDELSPLPHKHSSQSLMSPSSPLAPYTLEDIITNAQDEDLGSLGLMSDYGLLLAMGLPQLEQPETEHRGSVSSTSSCDISSPTESKEDLETTPLTTPEISPLSSPHLKESALPAEHPLSCAPPSPSPSPSPSQMAPSIGVAPSQHPLSSPFSALPPLPPPPPLPLLSDADLPISSEPATPTRAVKKRLSFATITSFFNPRHEEQETIKKKQQRSSSVPNVEHPLTAVGRQLAGFQRRHSLNDMHPNAPPAHVKSSSVPSSPPPFIAPPWDKDLLSAQAAHAAAEFMDENKTPTHAPSKLKGVFGKRNKKKKNAVVAGMVPTTPVTNPSNHVLATGKPLRPALVVRRAHRAPSIRSVKRAPSIRAPSIRHVHHRSSSHSQDTLGHSRKISTEHGGQGRTSLERSSTIVRHHRENTMGPGRVPKRSSSARISTSFSSPRSSEDYDLGATLAALRASPSTPRVLPIITKCSPPINPLATLSPTSSYGSLSSGSDSASESASSTSTVDPGVSTPNKRLSIHSDIPRRHSVDQAMPGMGQFLGSPGFSTAYSTPSSNAPSSMYFSGTSSPTVSSPHGNGPKMFSFPPQQQQPMPQYRNFHNHHPMPDHYQYNVHQQMMTSPPPPSQPHQQFNQAYPSPSHYQFHRFAGLQQQQQQHQQGQYTYTYPPQAPLPLLHFHHPLQPAPEYYHPMPHRMGPPPPPQGMRPFHFPAPQYPGMAVGGGYPVAPIPHHPSSPGPARAISRPVTPSRMMSVSESQGQGGKAGGRTVEFSAQSSVHQTWAADQYDRSSDPHITAQRLTPAIAHKIKLELNQFKSQEMVVHHESRLNTHFFV
ncbi:bud neck involved protein [Podila verticillata]|nr:bud neck involved protein [Podila verticillata]